MLLFRVSLVGLLSLALFHSVYAAEPKALQEGSTSLSFSLYSSGPYSVHYRKQISDTEGVYFGVGYLKNNYSTTSYRYETERKALYAGYRNYLEQARIASFTDLEMGYETYDYKSVSRTSGSISEQRSKEISIAMYYGLEYFVTRQFAIEGRAGLRASSGEDDDGEKTSTTSFPEALVRINYYWR